MLNLKRSNVNKFRSSKRFKKVNSRTKIANVKRPVFRGGIRF
jgi:hypothetical protein